MQVQVHDVMIICHLPVTPLPDLTLGSTPLSVLCIFNVFCILMCNVYVDFDSTVLGPLCGPNGRGILVPTLHFPFSVRAPFDVIMRAASPLSLTRVTFYTDTLNIYTQRDGGKIFVFVSTRVLKPPTLNCLMMSGDAKPGRGRSWSDKQ